MPDTIGKVALLPPEAGVQRALDHGPMRSSSEQFKRPQWKDWHARSQPVPTALQAVSQAFIDLQEARHIADYANHIPWSLTQAEEILNLTESAFRDWDSIRTDPMASDYLLSMLLGKRRS